MTSEQPNRGHLVLAIKKLVQLIKHLDIETDRLININGIEPEELGDE